MLNIFLEMKKLLPSLNKKRITWRMVVRRHLEKWRQYEYEACAMGALALLPRPKLKYASRGLFDPEDEFMDEIWRIRFDLRERFPVIDKA
jgi:hypothetical protein